VGIGLDAIRGDSSPVFTGLLARSWGPSLPPGWKIARFSSFHESSYCAPPGQHRATSTCRSRRPRTVQRLEPQTKGAGQIPHCFLNQHLRQQRVAYQPVGFQGSRPQRPGQFSSYQPHRCCEWDRKSQGRANPQASANRPLFQISSAEPAGQWLTKTDAASLSLQVSINRNFVKISKPRNTARRCATGNRLSFPGLSRRFTENLEWHPIMALSFAICEPSVRVDLPNDELIFRFDDCHLCYKGPPRPGSASAVASVTACHQVAGLVRAPFAKAFRWSGVKVSGRRSPAEVSCASRGKPPHGGFRGEDR